MSIWCRSSSRSSRSEKPQAESTLPITCGVTRLAVSEQQLSHLPTPSWSQQLSAAPFALTRHAASMRGSSNRRTAGAPRMIQCRFEQRE